jgi:hypothetical protein
LTFTNTVLDSTKETKPVAKKTAASTKKSVKAPKPTTASHEDLKLTTVRIPKVSTDVHVIKHYKKAKNFAVEQAATEVLSHKYSNQKKPSNKEILAKIK